MASIVRFIDAQFIKDNSVINDNMDNKYINTAIDLAMDKNMRQLIGSEFYDNLYSAVETANGVIASLSTAYQTLVQRNEFKNFLLWSVIANGTLYMTYKFQNKSIAKKSSENANPIDNYDLDKLVDEAKNNAEFYGERLLYWLRHVDNASNYPLLDDCGDIMAPDTAYKSAVFTGLKRPDGRNNNPNTRYGR